MKHRLAALALAAAAAAPAHALTVLSDGFETSPLGLNVGPIGWAVINGTVDMVGPGTFGELCLGSGRCVDLDGSTNKAGRLATTLSLTAGTAYTLSFDMAGNRRNAGSETVNVVFGATSAVLTFSDSSSTAPWQTHSLVFTPSTTGFYDLSFANAGGDNMGAMLDNVRVTAVPEPASALLLGAGLLTVSLLKRRRSA